MAKKGLGRGIAALLGGGEEAPAPVIETINLTEVGGPDSSPTPAAAPASSPGREDSERLVPLDAIKPNPDQPRKRFDETVLRELADSIKETGVINPLILKDAGGGSFEIIAGERRFRAAKLAGLTEVPALVRSYADDKRMIVSLIENVQREDLNPVEEAQGYQRLMELASLTQEEVSAKVGKNRSTVANALRLLKLPYAIQESLREGEISAGHARALLMVENPQKQDALFRDIVKRNLTVRQAEKAAASLAAGNKKKKDSKPVKGKPPEIDAMKEKFIHHLGTKVSINGDLTKGNIVIEYYSMEDLERIYEILGG